MDPLSSRARAIDESDLVIRVNSFVLDRPGEPPTQGDRADVVLWSRLVPATPYLFKGYSRRLYVLLEPMRMYGRQEIWPTSWPADLGFAVARNDAVAIPLNEALGQAWRDQRLAPTTGTTAVWLAVNLFPGAEVLVTGISLIENDAQTEWRHQWGDSVNVGPEHRIAAEAVLLRTWVADGTICLLSPRGDG